MNRTCVCVRAFGKYLILIVLELSFYFREKKYIWWEISLENGKSQSRRPIKVVQDTRLTLDFLMESKFS